VRARLFIAGVSQAGEGMARVILSTV